MPITYLGFNIADSMFTGDCVVTREELTTERFQERVSQGVISCLNRAHPATIRALWTRFGLQVETMRTPPRVTLEAGDSILVVTLRGLIRHTSSHHYTDDEVAQATFSFALWTKLN